MIDWKHLVRIGVIEPERLRRLEFADTVDEAFQHIRSELEEHHLILDEEGQPATHPHTLIPNKMRP